MGIGWGRQREEIPKGIRRRLAVTDVFIIFTVVMVSLFIPRSKLTKLSILNMWCLLCANYASVKQFKEKEFIAPPRRQWKGTVETDFCFPGNTGIFHKFLK